MKKSNEQGPRKLVATKGYSTTLALSTMNNILSTQLLRRDSTVVDFKYPTNRRNDRLFGVYGSGRSTVVGAGGKLEHVGRDRPGQADETCISAFVHLLRTRLS